MTNDRTARAAAIYAMDEAWQNSAMDPDCTLHDHRSNCMNAAIDAYLSALKEEGYKLVKREATEEMKTALQSWACCAGYIEEGIAAMWDAAPTAPALEHSAGGEG